MAVLLRLALPGVATEKYEALNTKLRQTPGILDGCVFHVCAKTGDGLEVFDVWESEQQLKAFQEKMVPIAAGLGWPQTGEPEILQVHNLWIPGSGS
ncbi:hypothetical protein GCM10010347_22160 [Streptomyces cirratus]|uniref:ABM domain-containing protein n=1 Tax=Streptomyces cirratus TaxID=68187 RepID=A0ABQ3EUU9_9ACTN|nr:hypothetical protein [Streptomyces cirratus]GHB51886.1 hypothetical protein GCM10010347_22160 [Streptomyces cirratus]